MSGGVNLAFVITEPQAFTTSRLGVGLLRPVDGVKPAGSGCNRIRRLEELSDNWYAISKSENATEAGGPFFGASRLS